MLAVAIEEARIGLGEGGVPVGAALFTREGELCSAGAAIAACRRAIPAFTAKRTLFAAQAASRAIATW